MPLPKSNHVHDSQTDDFRPRIVIWQLTNSASPEEQSLPLLNTQECLLAIDGIARLSKSILVFTGPRLMSLRPDLFDMVSYGAALGLKMILEIEPEELTEEVLGRFQRFGTRIFRIVLDGRVLEDINTRFRQTPEFQHLERTVELMKEMGFEIHFSLNIKKPNQRRLSYNLDYAFRRSAKGVYCHFHLVNRKATPEQRQEFEDSLGGFIERISELKSLVPSDMYCSPQCIKYTHYDPAEDEESVFTLQQDGQPRWINMCLAGKSFSFINEHGKVYVCSAMHVEGGDLREHGFDFRKVWSNSSVFKQLRDHRWSCVQTRAQFADGQLPVNGQQHAEETADE
jgi:MoaA/NifB/PqqE/SkfB family radical SAM enzyme